MNESDTLFIFFRRFKIRFKILMKHIEFQESTLVVMSTVQFTVESYSTGNLIAQRVSYVLHISREICDTFCGKPRSLLYNLNNLISWNNNSLP